MKSVIYNSRSAFIEDRFIMDNFIIAFEAFQSM